MKQSRTYRTTGEKRKFIYKDPNSSILQRSKMHQAQQNHHLSHLKSDLA
ncbi:hypothetical protein [Rubritalea tangerina]